MESLRSSAYSVAHTALQGGVAVAKQLSPGKLGPFLVATGAAMLPSASAQDGYGQWLCQAIDPRYSTQFMISGKFVQDGLNTTASFGCVTPKQCPPPACSSAVEASLATVAISFVVAGAALAYANAVAQSIINYRHS